MDEAEYCNRIALIDAGRIVAIGSPGELRRHELGGDALRTGMLSARSGTDTCCGEAPGVIDAAIFGDKLHVLLRTRRSGVRSAVLARAAAALHAGAPTRSRRAWKMCSFSSSPGGMLGNRRAMNLRAACSPLRTRRRCRSGATRAASRLRCSCRSMQMVLLGYGVSLDIKHVPLCIYDQENSQTSRELIERLHRLRMVCETAMLDSDRAVHEAMDRDTCIGALVIPVNFSRVLTTTGNADVQTVFDATDVNTAISPLAMLQGVIAQTTADFGARWAEAHGLRVPTKGQVDLEPRVWFNEGLDSRNFIMPGVVAMILALVGAQLTSLTVSREWERGTMEQLISTPVTALELMFGKLAPYFVIGLLDAAFCLGACRLLVPRAVPRESVHAHSHDRAVWPGRAGHRLPAFGSHPQSTRRQPDCAAAHHAADLPALGLYIPDRSDAGRRSVRSLCWSSARYYVTILRDIFLKGSSFADMAMPVLALLLYAAVIVWLAARAFHKRLD